MCVICRNRNKIHKETISLEIRDCTKIKRLPDLPEGLILLVCENLPLLKSLPILPSSLLRLVCVNLPLTNLPTLPSRLTSLRCENIRYVTRIPDLPSSLRYLHCRNLQGLKSLPDLTSLARLYCNNLPLITSIPVINKDTLVEVYNCKWLAQGQTPKSFGKKMSSLLICQRAVRNRKLRKFVKLTTSRSFNETFFAPDRLGGKWAKAQLSLL